MLRLMKKIYALGHKYRVILNLSIFLQFIESALGFVPIFATLVFYQHYTNDTITSSLPLTIFGILVTGIIARSLIRYVMDKNQYSVLYDIFADERIRVADYIKNVNMGYFSDDNVGKVTTILTNGISFIEEQGMVSVVQILTSGVTVIIIFGMLSTLDINVALIYLCIILLICILLYFYHKKTLQFGVDYNIANEQLSSAVIEYVRNISVIKAFSLIGKHNRSNEAFIERKRIDLLGEKINIPYLIGTLILTSIGSMSILYYLTQAVRSGNYVLYNVITLAILSLYSFHAIEVIAMKVALMDISADGIDAIESLYKLDTMTSRNSLTPNGYDIEFKNVEFAYEQKNVINNLSFKAEEHTMNAIVGLSGSGKSTIVNLIPRFFDVSKGHILIGGVDIRDMSTETLYESISMVFQDVYLFKDTIYNNIVFGDENASKEDVVNACKKAKCYNFIMALPDGFDTMVGEAGMSLSGGERQRISIARAILKDAPIILLDEATASVDPDNEADIQEAINALVENKTILVIAHKLSCVKNADNILVINNGELVEQGTHVELLNEAGLYSSLWKKRTMAKSWKIANN